MPRQRTHHSGITYVFPDDFPHRLERFKEESGLSWAEVARRPGISPLNMRRWKAGKRPNLRHQVALLELADQLDLGHLLTDWRRGMGRPARPGATEALRGFAGPPRRPSARTQGRRRHVGEAADQGLERKRAAYMDSRGGGRRTA